MQKQKKIQISEALPSVMTKTLGKANTICRVLSPRHSANMKYLPSVGIITLGEKLFFKKPNTVSKMFAECLSARHSAYYYHLPRAVLNDKEF